MRKLIIILVSVILLLSSFALGFFVKKSVDDKKFADREIEKEQLNATIDNLKVSNETLSNLINNLDIRPVDFFLYDEDPNRFDKININKNGNVEYKGKVIYNDNGEPLNDNTAYTTVEIKVLIAAKHIEPREGCDPGDTDKNGTLGCYIEIPDNN